MDSVVTMVKKALGADRWTRATAYRERHPDVPVVEDLDTKILAAIDAGGALDMGAWHGCSWHGCRTIHGHSCRTTHCRAGWAIHLAGVAGYDLERSHGPQVAAAMIYRASVGRVPDFFAIDAEALDDIRKGAAEEAARRDAR